jgi:predicted DCC family thiol-disulfide oxidoreductase YuxK
MNSAPNLHSKKIIFFDGYCHLCNGFIDFLATVNGAKNIYFASLQGETAKKILNESDLQKLETVIYYKSDKTYRKSTAVIQSLSDAFFLFYILKIFYIIPETMRNFIYDFVAKNRYKFFGQRETCRIPTAEESKNILP